MMRGDCELPVIPNNACLLSLAPRPGSRIRSFGLQEKIKLKVGQCFILKPFLPDIVLLIGK